MQDKSTIPTPKKNAYCQISIGKQYAGMDIVVIPLSSGAHAIVDADDFGLVSPHPWRETVRFVNTTYALVRYGTDPNRTQILMHRLIMGAPKGVAVDHINRHGLDNRRANLRIATKSQNAANMGPRKGKRYKGVYLIEATGKWQATITRDCKQHYLGVFDRAEDAAKAYDRAAHKLHGEFARLNFPEEHNDIDGDDVPGSPRC